MHTCIKAYNHTIQSYHWHQTIQSYHAYIPCIHTIHTYFIHTYITYTTYIFICTHICLCIHIYTHSHTHTYIHTYIHTFIHTVILTVICQLSLWQGHSPQSKKSTQLLNISFYCIAKYISLCYKHSHIIIDINILPNWCVSTRYPLIFFDHVL